MLKFSVIIPAFNREKTLEHTIYSLNEQVFKDFEILVVNDGSVDRTGEIAKNFAKQGIIRYYFQNNQGVSSARNLGASKAQTDWLLFLDSDDSLDPKAILEFDNFLKEIRSQPDAVFAGYVRVNSKTNEKNEYLPGEGNYSRLAGTFIIRKNVFDFLGGYDPLIKFGENTEFFHRFKLSNFSSLTLPKLTLVYNDHWEGGSNNLQNSTESIEYVLNKHGDTLSTKIKFLYRQILGVNYIRLRNFELAKKHLKEALKSKEARFSTNLRLLIAYLPFLARIVYPKSVK